MDHFNFRTDNSKSPVVESTILNSIFNYFYKPFVNNDNMSKQILYNKLISFNKYNAIENYISSPFFCSKLSILDKIPKVSFKLSRIYMELLNLHNNYLSLDTLSNVNQLDLNSGTNSAFADIERIVTEPIIYGQVSEPVINDRNLTLDEIQAELDNMSDVSSELASVLPELEIIESEIISDSNVNLVDSTDTDSGFHLSDLGSVASSLDAGTNMGVIGSYNYIPSNNSNRGIASSGSSDYGISSISSLTMTDTDIALNNIRLNPR